jgi:ribosomal protein S18 acetylase RimI-like enzyme
MNEITIHEGYLPGAVGAVAALHARYYSVSHGFDQVFEAKVARELGEFVCRYETARDRLWLVRRADEVLGSLVIDGGDGEGVAHLRWFILGDPLRGRGFGKRLMADAMTFCRDRGFRSVYLWTLSGLDAALHLYEAQGFVVVERVMGTQWGKAVEELKMECRLS